MSPPPYRKAPGGLLPAVLFWIAGLSAVLVLMYVLLPWRTILPDRWLMSASMNKALNSACVKCHLEKNPAIVADWLSGSHAEAGVDCYKCHRANVAKAVSRDHLKFDSRPITMVVSPLTCGGCHRQQADQFAASKHANTLQIIEEIDRWLNEGLVFGIETATGCNGCHGSRPVLENGVPSSATWPNVGIGRINPDGSRGSCSSCHTRHRFSKAEARRPEACYQCHLGPDHPQMEIYTESKHGSIYNAEGNGWRWNPKDGNWLAGRDYRAPTCAACHISGGSGFAANHDPAQRLSWELQAPDNIRPQDFSPWRSNVRWQQARQNMEAVCRKCHGGIWVRLHFETLDQALELYSRKYYQPVKTLMDQLYASGKLDRESVMDEKIELEFYQYWHHAGRRARMGVAMSAPDYAWWHGFYPLKKGYRKIFILASEPKANTLVWKKLPLIGENSEKDHKTAQ